MEVVNQNNFSTAVANSCLYLGYRVGMGGAAADVYISQHPFAYIVITTKSTFFLFL
jgi:hypothetical protein